MIAAAIFPPSFPLKSTRASADADAMPFYDLSANGISVTSQSVEANFGRLIHFCFDGASNRPFRPIFCLPATVDAMPPFDVLSNELTEQKDDAHTHTQARSAIARIR